MPIFKNWISLALIPKPRLPSPTKNSSKNYSMKKQLNIDAIQNELEGSVFFPAKPKDPVQSEPVSVAPEATPAQPTGTTVPPVVSRHHGTVVDTTIPRYHDTTTPPGDELLEAVRRAVKQVGKEAATQR